MENEGEPKNHSRDVKTYSWCEKEEVAARR